MSSSDREKKTGIVYVPSEIAQNLKVADENATFKYDESARNIVAQKSVLAYILKSALDEYAEYDGRSDAAGTQGRRKRG